MGRDKAELVVGGETLVARQIRIAREVGASPILVSVRPETQYAALGSDTGVITDRVPGRGPIEGLRGGLARTPDFPLLVLAVDLPYLEASFVRALVDRAAAFSPAGTVGLAPRLAGRWEPLAALYPRSCLSTVDAQIDAGRLAMHELLDLLHARGRLEPWDLGPEAGAQFANWNHPSDLRSIPASEERGRLDATGAAISSPGDTDGSVTGRPGRHR